MSLFNLCLLSPVPCSLDYRSFRVSLKSGSVSPLTFFFFSIVSILSLLPNPYKLWDHCFDIHKITSGALIVLVLNL